MVDRASRPPTLTPEDDELLRGLARAVQRRGLATPAVLWLESVRPLAFLGSQAMHFLTPFVPAPAFARLAVILEERSHLERLLQHIEACAAGDADRDEDSAPAGPASGGEVGPG